MKISSVNLKNFKKYENKTYNLTGLDMIIGKNGKGKSSVLQAISFALLGYVPGMTKTNEAIFALSKNGIDMLSVIDFDTMRIGRAYTYNKKITEDIIIAPLKNEKTLAEKQARIFSETGIEPLMIDFSEFLNMKDTEKKKYLYSLVGANWDKSKVKQYLDINIKNKSETLEKVIKETLEEYRDNYSAEEGINAMLNYLENKKKILNSELKKQDGGVQQLAELKNSLASTDRELENNKSKLNALNQQLVEIEKNITDNENKYNYLDKINTQIQKLINDNLFLKNKYDTLTAQLSNKNPNNRNYGLELDNINNEIKYLENNLSVLTNELKEIEKSGVGIKTQIECLQKIIDDIVAYKGYCAIDKNIKCTQNFTPYIIEKRKEINILSQNKAKLASQYKEKFNKIKVVQEQIIRLQEKRNIINKELVEQNKFNKIFNELNSIEAQSKAINNNIENLKKERISITVIDEVLLLKQKNAILSEINSIKTIIEEQNKAKVSLNLLQKTLLQKEQTKAEIDSVKLLLTHLGVKGLQGLIINEGLTPLQDKITDNLKLLGIENEFFFKSEGRTFDFGLKSDRDISFDSLSTGEKLMISLAIVSAIIEKKNPNLKILLLDNIENLDQVNRKKVLDALIILKEKFNNIIVVGALNSNEIKNIKEFNIFDLDKEEDKTSTLFDFVEEAI